MYVAFFYCEIDGSSLCLQCDMIVHVGGKRTHGRYLLIRQRIEVCKFMLRQALLQVLLAFREESILFLLLCPSVVSGG